MNVHYELCAFNSKLNMFKETETEAEAQAVLNDWLLAGVLPKDITFTRVITERLQVNPL